jgi:hypothetical protein
MIPKPSAIELVGVTKCFGSLVALERTDLVFEAKKNDNLNRAERLLSFLWVQSPQCSSAFEVSVTCCK